MLRQSHSPGRHRRLATHADAHSAFKHIREVEALAILELRPTTDDIDEAARRLGSPKRRMHSHSDTGVVTAIMSVLAGEFRQ
jgi:hypothetical protein